MLKVSTRGRYALRAMVDIGLHQSDGPVLRHHIAERQAISANYAAQLFRSLVSAGLVRSTKGPGGGYELAKPPTEICAGDVLRAIEGPIALVHCVLADDATPCGRIEHCVTHRLWSELSVQMETYLNSVTLENLINDARRIERRTS